MKIFKSGFWTREKVLLSAAVVVAILVILSVMGCGHLHGVESGSPLTGPAEPYIDQDIIQSIGGMIPPPWDTAFNLGVTGALGLMGTWGVRQKRNAESIVSSLNTAAKRNPALGNALGSDEVKHILDANQSAAAKSLVARMKRNEPTG